MKPVDVVGVRVEMPTNQPIVLLRERDGERYLPIWIGAVEATAIAYAQQGVEPARPLTHDLLADVIGGLGHQLRRGADHRPRRRRLLRRAGLRRRRRRSVPGPRTPSRSPCGWTPPSSRPRTCWTRPASPCRTTMSPSWAMRSPTRSAGRRGRCPSEGEVERFREFLDGISPEDFGTPGASGPEATGPESILLTLNLYLRVVRSRSIA